MIVPTTDLLRSWDSLRDAFDAARAAAARGDRAALRSAVRTGRTAASELYMSLDPARSPELADHVHGVLDLCMQHLDRAGHLQVGELDVPLRLLEAMRPSLEVGRVAPPESGFRLQSAAPARRLTIAAPRAVA
jgi:hypothetical protein